MKLAIVGCLPGGRFVAIECKRKGGRIRLTQLVWLEVMAAAGALVAVVDDVKDLESLLRKEGLLK